MRRLVKGDDPQLVMEQLSHALTNKLLHGPTHALHHATPEEREALTATLARLYRLQAPE
jgi:glutamyl-tRNA reductase